MTTTVVVHNDSKRLFIFKAASKKAETGEIVPEVSIKAGKHTVIEATLAKKFVAKYPKDLSIVVGSETAVNDEALTDLQAKLLQLTEVNKKVAAAKAKIAEGEKLTETDAKLAAAEEKLAEANNHLKSLSKVGAAEDKKESKGAKKESKGAKE